MLRRSRQAASEPHRGYLIAPEVEPTFVRLASQEIEIVLPDKVFRRVYCVAGYNRITRCRERRIGAVPEQRE